MTLYVISTKYLSNIYQNIFRPMYVAKIRCIFDRETLESHNGMYQEMNTPS